MTQKNHHVFDSDCGSEVAQSTFWPFCLAETQEISIKLA